MTFTDMPEFLTDLWGDLRDPNILWQAGVLALCLAFAWGLARQLRAGLAKRLATREAPGQGLGRQIQFVGGGFERLLFPLLALALVFVGRLVLSRFHHVNLLHTAIPLLTAFAAIRALVYLLRHVFASSGALATGERWIALMAWLAVALYFTGFLPELAATLDRVHFPVGKHHITLLLVLQAVASIALTLLISLWASALIEGRLMAAQSVDMSLRVVLGRVAKALLVLMAILVSLSLVGIDLTVLSVFGGALGVGLGLGLQRIASNYFSGFIILLDRSIRIGDMVTVDKYNGAVTQINTRYTVLKAGDGTEAIVPNELLVNSPVANLSFTTRENRLSIGLTVAYDSDLDLVTRILLEAAAVHARVLDDPAPAVLLKAFGADGLEMELGFWIKDPELGSINVKSDLNFAIWRVFQVKGVKIPCPQRDVRLLGESGT
jgi:small-conductance mechanosensitive channel